MGVNMNDEIPEVELPRGVALAWGVAANPQRGPKRELSIERIVEAAVEIADRDGLAAVSMSSVAASLGFTTMSLYRYVSAKEDLILLMQEYGTGLPPATIAEAPDWRSAMMAWSHAALASYEAHAWLVDIPILGTPNTPNNLAWMDVALAALDSTPLTVNERVGTLLLLSGQTRWEATILKGYTQSNQALGMTPSERDRADAHIIATLVTEELFPALYRAIQSGGFLEDDDEDQQFRFGLERLLDGIQHYIDSGKSTGTPTPQKPWQPPDSFPRDEAVKAARQARREAEGKLREAQKREREAIKKAEERAQKEREKRG